MVKVKDILEPVEIGVAIDKSGSMYCLKDDAIGGFNSFLAEQKKVDGEANITITQFNATADVKVDGINLNEAEELTKETYMPGGGTALYDGIGRTIFAIEERIVGKKNQKVIVAILTDGMENASKEYTASDIKTMIERKEADGWQFIYLAANQDAFAIGQQFGMKKSNSVNFKANSTGVKGSYTCMSRSVTMYRTGEKK